MRILFLTQWFDPEPGAMRGLPLAKWLHKRGHDIKILTGFPNYPGGKLYPGYRMQLWKREEIDGIPILRVPLYPSHNSSAVGRIANYMSFSISASTIGASLIGNADVGYVYHPPATVGLPGIVLKALRKIPFVYHIADMWPESVVESGMVGRGVTKKALEYLLFSLCSLNYTQAKAITVLSPGFKRLLIQRGVPSEKIHIIYNWTDETTFRSMPKELALAKELGFANHFNVVYAGNMGTFQGLETLIKAAVRVQHIPAIQIVMVGTGQKENELKALTRKLGLNNVLFLGRREYWDMPRIYSLCDVLVVHLKDLPFFSSTIPSKTQVSLACGRPVLMAVRGDAADLIEEAGAGVTSQPENEQDLANAIMLMYEMEKTELEAMGARGRAFYLNKMSMDMGAAKMEKLFKKIM